MATRISKRFEALRQDNRAGLVTFVTAGDPDPETSFGVLQALANSGADIIELGMPFTDPMADGPAIQKAAQRALASGQTQRKTLELVRRFRAENDETPIVLMGYYNPIYHYGVDAFLKDAADAGVDGLIVVDLPPEHDEELCLPARDANIDFIRLATPTTDAKRLPKVLENTSGFMYYVSVAGVTGARAPTPADVEAALGRIREHTRLPIGVGFGIRNAEQARAIGRFSEAVVVGSALVECIEKAASGDEAIEAVGKLTSELSAGVHSARN